MGICLKPDGIWSGSLPGSLPVFWRSSFRSVVPSLGMPRGGHHVCHVVCEEIEDACRVGVEDANFVANDRGSTRPLVVVKDGSVGGFGPCAEVGPEGGCS